MYQYSITAKAKEEMLMCIYVGNKMWVDLNQRELAVVYEKHPIFVKLGYLTRKEKPNPVKAAKAAKDDN